MAECLTLYQSIKKFQDSTNTALYFRNKKIDYISLVKRVDGLANKLYSLGIRNNTVVSLLAPNVPEAILALYALNKIGALVAILHPLIPINSLKDSLSETKASFLLILDVRYQEYESLLNDSSVKVYFLSAYPDLNPLEKLGFKFLYRKQLKAINKSNYLYRLNEEKEDFPLNTDSNKPSVYLRSGGTTGKSKTVILSDSNIMYPGTQSEWILNHKIPGISMIGLLPLFHGFGLSMGIVAPLMNNAASCLMIKYSGKEICSKIRQGKLNVLITIPYMCDKLLQDRHFKGKKLRNLYATYIGADKPEARLFQEFNGRMKDYGSSNRLLEGYGLTETVAVNFVNRSSDYEIGSVGKPLLGVKLRIASSNDYSKDIGPNKNGKIMISSPTVCLGYLNTGKERNPFYYDQDKTKWLITEDIGYYDEKGFLFFENRSQDVYKIAGYNVFPSNIEKYSNEVKGVLASKAIFIKDNNHPYFALFVKKESSLDSSSLAKEIKDHLLNCLIKYSLPEKIIVLSDFPYTSIGKIDEMKLIENLKKGLYEALIKQSK